MKPRYAQERHTHEGLTGGGGEGWSGIVNAAHASASSAVASSGFSLTAAGSTSSVDTAIVSNGTKMQRVARAVRKISGNYAGWYAASSQRWIHSVRGFHCRFMFGTVGYASASCLFAGLSYGVMPAASFTTFTGWAATYALGVFKNASTGTLDWVWRLDASTTGSASTGLSWRDGEVYTLALDCDPAGSLVAATLSNTYGESVAYTFSQFPNANATPACILAPAVLVGTGSSTTQLAFHLFDCVEPW